MVIGEYTRCYSITGVFTAKTTDKNKMVWMNIIGVMDATDGILRVIVSHQKLLKKKNGMDEYYWSYGWYWWYFSCYSITPKTTDKNKMVWMNIIGVMDGTDDIDGVTVSP